MQDERAQLTDRARALLLSFAVSHNASDFCRFLTVVAFRDLGATSAIMARVEPDGILRATGQYGQSQAEADGDSNLESQAALLKQSITMSRVQQASVDVGLNPDTALDFMAIPFTPTSEVQGALGLSFRHRARAAEVSEADIRLLSLLAELIAINSMPRIRTSGILSKLYFDSLELDDVSALTNRQLRVLDEMAIGKTNAQIARTLNVSESTIKQECVRLFKVLGVSTRQRAVAIGKEMGII
jgi:DNA-binding CsgD family transcriptional regulator